MSDGAGAVLLMKRSVAIKKGLPILGVFRYGHIFWNRGIKHVCISHRTLSIHAFYDVWFPFTLVWHVCMLIFFEDVLACVLREMIAYYKVVFIYKRFLHFYFHIRLVAKSLPCP